MPKLQVERSIFIQAKPQLVFEKVADYGTWTTWSPWLFAEPDAKVTVTPDPASVGSVYTWDGDIVGSGELEHLNLVNGQLIEDEIRFKKPFKSKSFVQFRFHPQDGGTHVSWKMDGSLPWFLFWMKPTMTSLISMDYDRGLRLLKEWIETGKIESDVSILGVENISPIKMMGIRQKCSFNNIGPEMRQSYEQCSQLYSNIGLSTEGDPITVYHQFDIKNQAMEFTSGFVVDDFVDHSELRTWSIGNCQALVTEHTGSYDNLGNAWSAAHQYARYKKLKQSKIGTFEIYANSSESAPSSELKTRIYLPLR